MFKIRIYEVIRTQIKVDIKIRRKREPCRRNSTLLNFKMIYRVIKNSKLKKRWKLIFNDFLVNG